MTLSRRVNSAGASHVLRRRARPGRSILVDQTGSSNLRGKCPSAGGDPAVSPGAGEPYSAALVFQVAEAVGGACGSLHGPVRRLGPGVGDAGLQVAQHLGPPGLNGAGQALELGQAGAGAPAVKRCSRCATSCRCPPVRAVASSARSSSLAIQAVRISPVASPSTRSFHNFTNCLSVRRSRPRSSRRRAAHAGSLLRPRRPWVSQLSAP